MAEAPYCENEPPLDVVYSSEQLSKGVPFLVRYVGCMGIPTSMKTLDFDVRTSLAKECIFRVCEKANYIDPTNRQVDKKVKALLAAEPNLSAGGRNVSLVVSSRALAVRSADDGAALFTHPMPNISFASGGDEETCDFVCYVGKDETRGRCCFIFECGASLASKVLATVGQAFAQRFHEFQRQHADHSPPQRSTERSQSSGTVTSAAVLPSPPQSISIAETEGGLRGEPWFHGAMGRTEAEALLREDGDFLVRGSGHDPARQFVLTGRQNGTPRHLLLIDANGKVRTRDREFQSVSHLIQYHRDNNIPITSAESALLLKNPVLRAKPVVTRC